jgi:hypothetical protein
MKQAKVSPCGGERSAVLSAGVQSKMKAYMAPWLGRRRRGGAEGAPVG